MTDYSVVERTRVIAAPSEAILPLLVDFHRWLEWSPWEGLDPALRRTYSGPTSGAGATYTWSGNRKAGAGSMTITAVGGATVDLDLEFTRPFKSRSKVGFTLDTAEAGTLVTWQMRTPKTVLTRIFGLVMNMDKAIGKDLERGLGNLQRVVERR